MHPRRLFPPRFPTTFHVTKRGLGPGPSGFALLLLLLPAGKKLLELLFLLVAELASLAAPLLGVEHVLCALEELVLPGAEVEEEGARSLEMAAGR